MPSKMPGVPIVCGASRPVAGSVTQAIDGSSWREITRYLKPAGSAMYSIAVVDRPSAGAIGP